MADTLVTLAVVWAGGALIALFVTLLLFVSVDDEDERTWAARIIFASPLWPALLVWWLSRGIAAIWRAADWGNR